MVKLPELPRSYLELDEAFKKIDDSYEPVLEVIKKEPALVARIMKISNSAFFGVEGGISSIEEAITLLGFEMIKSLALMQGLAQSLTVPKTSGLDAELLWHHSVQTSLIVKDFGKRNHLRQTLVEEAYTVALLHDLGKLILAHIYDEKYCKALKTSHDQNIPLWQIEKDVFGNCHAEVGAHLLKLWGLPPSFVDAVEFHHRPHRKKIKASNVTDLVHLADCIENRNASQTKFFTPGTFDTNTLRCFPEIAAP